MSWPGYPAPLPAVSLRALKVTADPRWQQDILNWRRRVRAEAKRSRQAYIRTKPEYDPITDYARS